MVQIRKIETEQAPSWERVWSVAMPVGPSVCDALGAGEGWGMKGIAMTTGQRDGGTPLVGG